MVSRWSFRPLVLFLYILYTLSIIIFCSYNYIPYVYYMYGMVFREGAKISSNCTKFIFTPPFF